MSDAETVERVARAIFVKDFPSGSVKGRWDEVSEPMRDDYRTCARAAIAAMPSPTVQEAARVLLNDDISLSRMSKAMHDGPLGADEYEYRASTKAGGWCLECVRAALRALTEQEGE